MTLGWPVTMWLTPTPHIMLHLFWFMSSYAPVTVVGQCLKVSGASLDSNTMGMDRPLPPQTTLWHSTWAVLWTSFPPLLAIGGTSVHQIIFWGLDRLIAHGRMEKTSGWTLLACIGCRMELGTPFGFGYDQDIILKRFVGGGMNYSIECAWVTPPI